MSQYYEVVFPSHDRKISCNLPEGRLFFYRHLYEIADQVMPGKVQKTTVDYWVQVALGTDKPRSATCDRVWLERWITYLGFRLLWPRNQANPAYLDWLSRTQQNTNPNGVKAWQR